MLELKPERLGIDEFKVQPIAICGKVFEADLSGALYWPAEEALIVADLHLEKGSAFAARGQMLPPYDTRETLHRLAEAVDRTGASAIIALGDSFHDAGAGSRLAEEDRETIRIMQGACEWIWITGNHDPEIAPDLGGHVFPEVTLEGITLRHEPAPGGVTHEIAGHLHPAARLSLHGYSIRRPCFVGNGRRLVMPAFGTYSGGLNILDPAFDSLFGNDGMAVWMLGQEGLYPVATRLLKED